MKNTEKLLYKTEIPRGLYSWIALPIVTIIAFYSFGMEFSGAVFYGLVSFIIYLATNPDFCQISVYEGYAKITYFRLFNRVSYFDLNDFESIHYRRGELFNAIPFLMKPVHLNDYIEFYVDEKKDEKISLNVKCNRKEARKAIRLMNFQHTPNFTEVA